MLGSRGFYSYLSRLGSIGFRVYRGLGLLGFIGFYLGLIGV